MSSPNMSLIAPNGLAARIVGTPCPIPASAKRVSSPMKKLRDVPVRAFISEGKRKRNLVPALQSATTPRMPLCLRFDLEKGKRLQ